MSRAARRVSCSHAVVWWKNCFTSECLCALQSGQNCSRLQLGRRQRESSQTMTRQIPRA